MKLKLPLFTLLGCFMLLLLCHTAKAQDERSREDSTRYYQYYRADNSLYFKGRLGLNFYGGDRDINPANEIQKYIENIGFSLGLEVGYAFTERFSLGLMHLSGLYPRIEDNRADFPKQIDQPNSSKWRHHFSLIGRSYILPRSRISPYGQMGVNVSFGKINDEMRTGIGPMAALGLDAAVSDRLGIFIELNGIFTFDDDALDLADTRARNQNNAEGGIDASDFDAFTFFGFGLRYTLKSPIVPVVAACTAPTQLRIGEPGTFAATINENATRPIEYRWDFGDGSGGGGALATHAYARSGDYSVTITATNKGGTSTALCRTKVLAPPTCQIQVTPASLSMCTQPLPAVQFRSTVTGDAPIEYRWDFGDGTSSTEANPTHTYTRLDADPVTTTQSATLRVSNVAGSASCTVDVNIAACPCADNIQLARTYFDRHESILKSDQTLQNLRDNMNILLQSPSTLIFIEGYATANERNAQTLATDRARAVAKFYTDNGIPTDRIQIEGTVLTERPKSGVPGTITIPYCAPQSLDQKRQQVRQEVQNDLRRQGQN